MDPNFAARQIEFTALPCGRAMLPNHVWVLRLTARRAVFTKGLGCAEAPVDSFA